MTVGPQYSQFLGFEHDMPVHASKERQQTIVCTLDLAQVVAA
jgi:hypothetical protein